MRRAAARLLLLAAIGAAGCGYGRGGGNAEPGTIGLPPAAGPELLLSAVEFREVRPDGRVYRMTCDRARYAIERKDLEAWDVVVKVPEGAGRILVRAPRATWATEAGRIALPDGGTASNESGWDFRVSRGQLDLSARVLSAPEARLSGPGVAVAGDNLVWRWGDGKATLDQPRSRVEPARLGRTRG